MSAATKGIVTVTRRIEAPASELFAFLSDPATHPSFDGSGMLVDGGGNQAVSATGDVFSMKMHNDEMGAYEMANHVVDYRRDRRIVWEPVLRAASRAQDQEDIGNRTGHRWGYELEPDGPEATIVTETFDCTQAPERLRVVLDYGNRWLANMEATLEALDRHCAHTAPPTESA